MGGTNDVLIEEAVVEQPIVIVVNRTGKNNEYYKPGDMIPAVSENDSVIGFTKSQLDALNEFVK